MPEKSYSSKVLDAWVRDIQEQEKHPAMRPVIQVDIIPLFCSWVVAWRKEQTIPPTVFRFTDAAIHHNELPAVWYERATDAGDMAVSVATRSFSQYLKMLQSGPDPYQYQLQASTHGRTYTPESAISGLEVSLLGAIGHAAYNSDGEKLLVLTPDIGPGKDAPNGYLRYAGAHLLDVMHTVNDIDS